tara:strand:- start:11592 stop:12509 length:918 start_codon:yes stop_codon:yes gene_type:complete
MEKLPKKELYKFIKENNLNVSSNAKGFLHIIIHLTIIITLIIFSYYMYLLGSFFLFGLALVLYFFTFSFLGPAGISHELYHNNVFKTKILNKVFYYNFMCLTLNNPGYFKNTHHLHHKHTLTHSDPKTLFKGSILGVQTLFWLTFDFIGFCRRIKILLLNSVGITVFNDPKSISNCMNGSRIIIIYQVLLFLLLTLLNLQFMYIFLVCGNFCFTLPNKLLAFSQHYGHEKTVSLNNNFFENTYSLKLPSFISFLYANMNYHVEHHFVPSVPFYNLPKIQDFMIMKTNHDYTISLKRFFSFLLQKS